MNRAQNIVLNQAVTAVNNHVGFNEILSTEEACEVLKELASTITESLKAFRAKYPSVPDVPIPRTKLVVPEAV